MFSPWTGGLCNFWLSMSVSAIILSVLALSGNGVVPFEGLSRRPCSSPMKAVAFNLLAGIVIAFALWGVFWVGDKLSQMFFGFARGQVDLVYGMKDGSSPALVAVLLLFLIGPAEEYFWRGYVQKTVSELIGATPAMFVTAAVYALVHIWSLNFMLVMAALVAGGVWGLLYRLKPSLLPALIISHALWDALVFIILPI